MTDISVIIPTYNRRHSLNECLESLVIQERAPNFEAVIVDDGSTDGTDKLIGEVSALFPKHITYVRQEHSGISKACNVGISRSQGKVIVFTEDDCVLPKNWIEKISWYHANFPEVTAIQGRILNYYRNNLISQFEQTLYEVYSEKFMYHLGRTAFTTFLLSGNCSFKSNLLSKYRISFRETLRACEDVDFGYQIVNKKQKILYAEDIVVFHKHRTTLSSFIKKTVRDERNRLLIERVWHKENPAIIKAKSVDISLFYNFALRCIKKYQFKGLLMIGILVLHRITRSIAYCSGDRD